MQHMVADTLRTRTVLCGICGKPINLNEVAFKNIDRDWHAHEGACAERMEVWVAAIDLSMKTRKLQPPLTKWPLSNVQPLKPVEVKPGQPAKPVQQSLF